MAWLAALLSVLIIFWVLGKLTGKKIFREFPERIGLSGPTVALLVVLLAVILFLVFN